LTENRLLFQLSTFERTIDNPPMPAPKLKRWEILPSTGGHLDVLDGLRGVAILLVVSYHALYTNPASGLLSRLAGDVFTAGWMGVPIFFVLSGFLISYPFFKGRVPRIQASGGSTATAGGAWQKSSRRFISR
jgi:hypothetical protein